MLFCPGRGSLGLRERSLFAEPDENIIFSKATPLSFSTNLEMN
jgi:hypothetical protein